MLADKGDRLPVSAFPVDGTLPTATSQYEKRNIALEIPRLGRALCIQCGMCSFVCPHAAIRTKFYPAEAARRGAGRASRRSTPSRATEFKGHEVHHPGGPRGLHRLRRSASTICPAKDKNDPNHKAINMTPSRPLRDAEAEELRLLPRPARRRTASSLKLDTVKGSQLLEPLFEFSGACAGCGETPYLKLMSQLFGDRAIIANATGCSSIYGGNLPTTPYAQNADGRGPAWSNSLFEDNAEFGFGMRLAVDKFSRVRRRSSSTRLGSQVGDELVKRAPGEPTSTTEAGIEAQRDRVLALRRSSRPDRPRRRRAASTTSPTTWSRKSVWIVGGDGWAYDIGYGGLDHVIASRHEREHPGARHRGVLQHRRPGLQVHPAGRRRPVRRRRQVHAPRRTWA